MIEAHEAAVRGKLIAFVEGAPFRNTVMALIVINAVTMGLETYPAVRVVAHDLFRLIDVVVLTVFVVEIALKLYVYRARFFADGWNVFDFLVVGMSLFPNAGPFTVLRTLRVMRLFRILSVSPQLRRVVEALFRAIPGMAGIITVLFLVFYVFAVIATRLFRDAAPESFGTLGESALTLFQVMTLEGWAEVMQVVRETHPWAWVFFLAFIFLSSFAVLNLFIAVIVDALQREAFVEEEERDEADRRLLERQHAEVMDALQEMRALVGEARRRGGPDPGGES